MQLGAGWATTAKRSSNRWVGIAVTVVAILALALTFLADGYGPGCGWYRVGCGHGFFRLTCAVGDDLD